MRIMSEKGMAKHSLMHAKNILQGPAGERSAWTSILAENTHATGVVSGSQHWRKQRDHSDNKTEL